MRPCKPFFKIFSFGIAVSFLLLCRFPRGEFFLTFPLLFLLCLSFLDLLVQPFKQAGLKRAQFFSRLALCEAKRQAEAAIVLKALLFLLRDLGLSFYRGGISKVKQEHLPQRTLIKIVLDRIGLDNLINTLRLCREKERFRTALSCTGAVNVMLFVFALLVYQCKTEIGLRALCIQRQRLIKVLLCLVPFAVFQSQKTAFDCCRSFGIGLVADKNRLLSPQ